MSLIWLLAAGGALAAGDPGARLRERFLGADGLPSESAYLQAEGLAPAPGSESYAWRAVFKLTYRPEDLSRPDRADPIAADCYLIRSRKYAAPHRAVPVWDGRVYQRGDKLVVAAYTPKCEQVAGEITEDGAVAFGAGRGLPGAPAQDREPSEVKLPEVRYNPFTGRLWRRERGGAIVEEQPFYLPLPLITPAGERARCQFEVVARGSGRFALVARSGAQELALAECAVSGGPSTLRPAQGRPEQRRGATSSGPPQGAGGPSRAESRGGGAIIGTSEGYAPELGPGCVMPTEGPTTIVEVEGELSQEVLDARGAELALLEEPPAGDAPRPRIAIDGDFSDWRSVSGIADPRGDTPGYLDYNPDTDLLEFKVASDATHLYLYTRVSGRHGNSAKGDDRYYYYVYIDADRDPETGYVPTRDDDCYYGVALGDDCEAQFEFVGGRFVKTFFGFTGVGTEKEVLAGRVRLGRSWYGKHDSSGRVRDRYKVEYVKRAGKLQVTGDYTEGTSEDIVIGLSPDGSECEMGVELAGFLRDASGRQIIAPGQRIDLAVGAEASGAARGNHRWGADSTGIIHGYLIAPE